MKHVFREKIGFSLFYYYHMETPSKGLLKWESTDFNLQIYRFSEEKMITATLCACTVSETNYSICEVSKVFTWPLLETGNQEDCCTINHKIITQARGVARGKSMYRHHYSRGSGVCHQTLRRTTNAVEIYD